MVPTAQRQWSRQARQLNEFPGEAAPASLPAWNYGDDSDEEVSRGAKQRRSLSRDRNVRRDAETTNSLRRRNVQSESAADSSAGRLVGRDSELEDDDSEDDDKRSRRPSRIPTRTRALPSSSAVPAQPTVPAPAPTSAAPQPPPPPPPPPQPPVTQPESSSSAEPSSTETPTVDAQPTTLFRPLPEPSPSSSSIESSSETTTSTTTSSESTAPVTTVTVGNPQSTQASSTSSTPAEPAITTPVVAFPILPSEIRKGVDGDRTTDTDNEASPTARVPKESTPADRAENDQNGGNPGVHKIAPTHAAMHALGSIGGVLVIAAFLVFVWWYFKKYRPKKRLERGDPPPAPKSLGRFGKLLPFNKFSRKPAQDREWTAESAPSVAPSLNEKEMQIETTYENAYQRRPESVGEQYFAPAQLAVAIPPAHIDPNGNEFWTTWTDKDGRPGHMPNQQSISSTAGQFNSNTLRTNPPYYKRTSEVSSLSSGFGDGEMMMAPSTANNTMDMAALTQLRPPPPTSNPRRFSARTESTSRDTWYTEASEDQPARFRTINSWVRQQTGRIKREKQRQDESDVPPVPALPAEEEYRMMMPDGEEPRRVDMNMDIGVAYSGTR